MSRKGTLRWKAKPVLRHSARSEAWLLAFALGAQCAGLSCELTSLGLLGPTWSPHEAL